MLYLLPAGLFLFALIGRCVATTGFLERPLALGLCWFFITGDAFPALPFAVFFEMFWLDAQPIGSYLPPMPAFPYLLFLAFVEGGDLFSSVLPVLAIILPTAYIIPYLEQMHRDGIAGQSTSLLARAASGVPLGGMPGRIIVKSAGRALLGGLVVFLAVLCVGKIFFATYTPIVSNDEFGTAQAFYVAGCAGALLALRLARAYAVFAFGVAASVFVVMCRP